MPRTLCLCIFLAFLSAGTGCNDPDENSSTPSQDTISAPVDTAMPTVLPLIVAHRGASYLAPENTLPAFNLAWELGADLVEGDFYLTSDGFVVCHHDRTTKKTAGVDRAVEEQTLAELKRHDVGRRKGAKWAGTTIPTLAEVLATVPVDKTILIEIKSDVRIVPAVLLDIEESGLEPDQITIICFQAAVIAVFKEMRPDIKAFWLTGFERRLENGDGWDPTIEKIIETAKRIQADGVAIKANLQVIDRVFVDQLRAAGLEFHVWTVDDPAVARALMELGVDSITTNRPGYLRAQLESGG